MTAAARHTVLIIGANRGIGFELATRFKAKEGFVVFGTYRPQTREDESVTKLRSMGVETLELDYADADSITAAARRFDDLSPALNTLINCAGVYHLWDDKTFDELTPDNLSGHFQVNVVGPFMTSKAFLPALSRASAPTRIVNVSSDMASIADNANGGNACYRISKTALNQLTKTMAVDLAKKKSSVLALAVHPGWVATKMTGYYGENDMENCMDGLVDTITRFGTDGGKDLPNGGYVRWDGAKMDY